MSTPLTHIDDQGHARMVDVTAKPLTRRVAEARCQVVTTADAAQILSTTPDGFDVVEAARIAGIQAAKSTSSLIPLCHAVHIDRVEVSVVVHGHQVAVRAVTEITERTGVEMEALTACAIAAATVVKALMGADPEASIEDLTLWHKSGGRSGDWDRLPDGQMTHSPAPEEA